MISGSNEPRPSDPAGQSARPLSLANNRLHCRLMELSPLLWTPFNVLTLVDLPPCDFSKLSFIGRLPLVNFLWERSWCCWLGSCFCNPPTQEKEEGIKHPSSTLPWRIRSIQTSTAFHRQSATFPLLQQLTSVLRTCKRPKQTDADTCHLVQPLRRWNKQGGQKAKLDTRRCQPLKKSKPQRPALSPSTSVHRQCFFDKSRALKPLRIVRPLLPVL